MDMRYAERVSGWRDVTVAAGATTTDSIDLLAACDFMQIYIPTITLGTVGIQVASTLTGTFASLGENQTTPSSTGNFYEVFFIGRFRYIKVVCSAAQGAMRTFSLVGLKKTN